MNDVFIQFSQFLESLGVLAGMRCIWKSRKHFSVETRLEAKYRQHTNPFCAHIKKNAAKHKKCLENDFLILPNLMEPEPAPFLHRCHAKVHEIIIPVNHEADCLGFVIVGPFQTEDDLGDAPRRPSKRWKLPLLKDPESHVRALAQVVGLSTTRFAAELHRLDRENREDGITDRRIRFAVQYIRTYYPNKISLPEVAQMAHISPSRLTHLFSECYGYSFQAFLLNTRLEAARHLLLATNASIGEIAAQTGFSSQSRLSYFFMNKFHHLPSKYRKDLLNLATPAP